MDDRLQENAEKIIDWFSSITAFTQGIVFPPFFQGAVEPPNMTDWSKIRKLLYRISSPIHFHFSTQSTIQYFLQIINFFIWTITLFLWSSITVAAFDYIFGISEKTDVNSPISSFWEIILTIFIVITILLVPLAYYRWVEFMRNNHYHIGWRLFFLILFAGFIILFPLCILEPKYRYILSVDSQNRFLFIFIYCLFWIPYLTQVYIMAIEIIVLIGRALVVIITYLLSAHDPFPKNSLKILLMESPIENLKTKEKKHLLEFSKYKLETIHKWSKANRESTNKRLLPTTLFFAFLALFSTPKMFENAIDQFLIWLSYFINPVNQPNFEFLHFAGKATLVVIIFLFIGIFFSSLIRLIGNLVTQSVIIEACIIAEFAQSKETISDNSDSKIQKKSFWQRLFKL